MAPSFLFSAEVPISTDKAYDTKEIRDHITVQDAVYTIPPKENNADPWPCDFPACKERHWWMLLQ